jgi:hypothetical protein
MPATTFVDTALNQFLFGGSPLTPPATYYVGLSTTVPTQNQGTAAPFWNFTEPSDSAYARVAVPNDTAHWVPSTSQPAVGQQQSNDVVITFPVASVAWGTITYVGLFDSLTGGSLWFMGLLTTPLVVNQGATVLFPVQTLSVASS